MPYRQSYHPILNTILFCIATVIFSANAYADTHVSATVSNNDIVIGDFIDLTITVNDSDDDYQFDPSELNNHFNVSRPSQSNQTQYINGTLSQQTQWRVKIQAKQLGKIDIPALKIGDLYTQVITINVRKSSQKATTDSNVNAFIENSVNKQSLYLGQPLTLTSIIYLDQASQAVNELQLVSPVLENAQIKVIGEDVNGSSVRNGIQYQTIKRIYQIDTQETGTLIINSPLLTGSLRKVVRIDDWKNRVVAQAINIRGDALTVTIKTLPKTVSETTLISDDIHLFEASDFATKALYVGEPITRKITLQAASITKDHIPTINFNYSPDLRFYPDKDKITEGTANGLTYIVREMQHAIIPDKAGELVLPEIKLAWWNSKTDKQAFATIPARTLTILPPKNSENAIGNPIVDSNQNKTPAIEKTKTIYIDNNALIYWQIATLILLFALLLLVAYHFYYRKQVTQNLGAKNTPENTNISAIKALEDVFIQNNPNSAYIALLKYSQVQYPQSKTITQISALTNLATQEKISLEKEIKKLSLACTAKSNQWGHQALLILLKDAEAKSININSDDVMKINPTV